LSESRKGVLVASNSRRIGRVTAIKFANEEASFINGEILTVDGGY